MRKPPALYEPAARVSTMPPVRIGTVDLPERIERSRYFAELPYLELSALHAAPWKAGALAKWQAVAPARGLGLLAPWVLTHRKAPKSERLWHHDATVGDFRDSAHARSALAVFREAATALQAAHAIFASPSLFAPSTANRDQLKRFFGEVATEEATGAPRVWIPDGLWEPRSAVKFAGELGVTCAIDPLVYDPATPAEVYEDLEASALYFRVAGLGRSGSIRDEKLEDLAGLVEHYGAIDLTVAFASPARWNDARNFKRLVGDAVGGLSDALGDDDSDDDLSDDDADLDDDQDQE